MDAVARRIQEWVAAGVIDSETAERIGAFESNRARAGGWRWPVVLAVAFGAVMVSAGVLLFVSAHWDRLSPFARMSIVVALVLVFHVAGALLRNRFETMAVAMHALGTMALGGGLYLTGQIYNLDTGWPMGALLWTVGALAGWALLRQWPQAALVAVLLPFWLTVEYDQFLRVKGVYHTAPAAAGWLMLAFTYLSSRVGDQVDPIRRALVWIGAVMLFPAVLLTNFVRHNPANAYEFLAHGVGAALSLSLAYFIRRERAVWNVVAVLWVLALVAISPSSLLRYVWIAVGAAALTAWGIHERRPERINLGVAGFALTVLFFYFDSVMDKIGRSASLIGLGVLFLAGGYALERVRRRLMGRISGDPA